MPIRIVLADDHPLVRAGIRSSLTLEDDLTLVGEAIDGYAAQMLSQELQPDVLLLDVNMPGPSAVEAVHRIVAEYPAVKVLVLTAYSDDVYVKGLVAAGVVGYVLKDEAPEVVVEAIRTVVQGHTWFSQRVVEKLGSVRQPESGGRECAAR